MHYRVKRNNHAFRPVQKQSNWTFLNCPSLFHLFFIAFSFFLQFLWKVNLSFFTLQYQQLYEQLAVQSFLHSPCEITEPSQQEEHQVRTSRSTLVFDRTVALPLPGLVALQCSTALYRQPSRLVCFNCETKIKFCFLFGLHHLIENTLPLLFLPSLTCGEAKLVSLCFRGQWVQIDVQG